MRALVAGATGFVGRKLVERLERPLVLSRDPERARRMLGGNTEVYQWEPQSGPPPLEALRDIEVVFNLAGEPVAEGRWTPAKKERIRESRVRGTRNLVAGIELVSQRPRVLISASAVGYYGDRGDELIDENAAPGKDFLAEVCQSWEAEGRRASTFGVRVVTPRIGIVLGRSGGALARMLPPFKLGLGGRLASGRQWMPWIHLDDLIGLLLHAAAKNEISGAMNAVGPAPATNREFTQALARVLHRPAIFPVPGFALRLGFGELGSMLLYSQRALPRVAEKTGYRFIHPDVASALQAALGQG